MGVFRRKPIEIYGYWLYPDGTEQAIVEQSGHTFFQQYEDADENGSIAVVVSERNRMFCARYNNVNVTSKALATLLKIYRDHEHLDLGVCAENIWTTQSYYGRGKSSTKDFNRFIRGEIKRVTNKTKETP